MKLCELYVKTVLKYFLYINILSSSSGSSGGREQWSVNYLRDNAHVGGKCEAINGFIR